MRTILKLRRAHYVLLAITDTGKGIDRVFSIGCSSRSFRRSRPGRGPASGSARSMASSNRPAAMSASRACRARNDGQALSAARPVRGCPRRARAAGRSGPAAGASWHGPRRRRRRRSPGLFGGDFPRSRLRGPRYGKCSAGFGYPAERRGVDLALQRCRSAGRYRCGTCGRSAETASEVESPADHRLCAGYDHGSLPLRPLGIQVLPKPFTRAELAEKITSVLTPMRAATRSTAKAARPAIRTCTASTISAKTASNRRAASDGRAASWDTREIRARGEPAPIRRLAQRQKDRPAERAGEMRDRRVGGDDQIAIGHHRRGVEEGVGAGIEIGTEGFEREARGLWAPASFIRLIRRTPGIAASPAKPASGILRFRLILHIAAPADADPEALPPDPLRPGGDPHRLGMQIRHFRPVRSPATFRRRRAGSSKRI